MHCGIALTKLQNKFCSRSHSNSFNKAKPKVLRVCPTCSSTRLVWQSKSYKKCCSKECAKIYRGKILENKWKEEAYRKLMIKSGRPCSPETKEKIRIKHLGSTASSLARANLSKALKGRTLSEVDKHNKSIARLKLFNDPIAGPIAREQLRTSAINRANKGIGKFTDTKPELKVKAHLDSLGIVYEHPKRVSRFSVDFYIPSTNIIIEVDGCWWHCCPIHCPYPEKGEMVRFKDRVRTTNLIESGFLVIRIWEHDIMRSEVYKEILNGLL